MLADPKLTQYTFSELEKIIKELTRLQVENLNLLFELEETKLKVLQAKHFHEVESKLFSGIKKYFRGAL